VFDRFDRFGLFCLFGLRLLGVACGGHVARSCESSAKRHRRADSVQSPVISVTCTDWGPRGHNPFPETPRNAAWIAMLRPLRPQRPRARPSPDVGGSRAALRRCHRAVTILL
jgi:hypothetical protein